MSRLENRLREIKQREKTDREGITMPIGMSHLALIQTDRDYLLRALKIAVGQLEQLCICDKRGKCIVCATLAELEALEDGE